MQLKGACDVNCSVFNGADVTLNMQELDKSNTYFAACFDRIWLSGLQLTLNIRENKLSLPEMTTFT